MRAAINAAKRKEKYITNADVNYAFVKVGIGVEKRSKIISEKKEDYGIPRIRTCNFISSASGCRSGAYDFHYSDGNGGSRLYYAVAGTR